MKIDNVRWEIYSPERQRREQWQGRVAAVVVLGAAAACWALVIAVVLSLI